MNQAPLILAKEAWQKMLPLFIFMITLAAGYIIRKVIFARLIRLTRNTKTKIDDIIIASVKGPFVIWFIMLGLFFAFKAAVLPANLAVIADKTLLVLGILSVTFVLAGLGGKLISLYSYRIESSLPVTSLTQNISRIIIFGVGILIIL